MANLKIGQVFQRTYRGSDGQQRTCDTWTIRYFRNGRPSQEATKFTRKGDAVELLKRRVGDIAKGLPVSAASVKLTIDQALADVEKDYRVNGKRTLSHVERRIAKHLTPYFGGRRLASITSADIRAYTEARQTPKTRDDGTVIKAGASNAEINRELAIVKRACRLAQQAGTLLAMPHIPMLDEHNLRGVNYFRRSCCLRRECYQRTGAVIETECGLSDVLLFFFPVQYGGDRLWECGNLAGARFPSRCGNRSLVSIGTSFP